MDSKISAPLTVLQDSYSSGSSSPSSPSSSSIDSSIDNSLKETALDVENNSKSISSSSDSDSVESSDDGFMSGGEEEFEIAPEELEISPEEPSGIDMQNYEESTGGDDYETPLAGSLGSSISDSLPPIARLSADDEDEDEIEGDSEVRVLEEESFQEVNNSVTEIGVGDSVDGVEIVDVNLGEKEVLVENGSNGDTNLGEIEQEKVVGGEDELKDGEGFRSEVYSCEELVAEEANGAVENGSVLGAGTDKLAETQKFANGEDSVVEADLVARGAVVVGDMEENMETEVKELVQMDHYYSESVKVEPNEQESDVDLNSDAGAIIAKEVVEEKVVLADPTENMTVGSIVEEKPVADIADETDAEAKMETVSDRTQIVPTDNVDGDVNDTDESVNIITESTQAAVNASEVVSTEKMEGEDGDTTHEMGFVAEPHQANAEAAEDFSSGKIVVDLGSSVDIVGEATQASGDVEEVVSRDNFNVQNGDATEFVDFIDESTHSSSEPGQEVSEKNFVTSLKDILEDIEVPSDFHSPEAVKPSAVHRQEFTVDEEDGEDHHHPDDEAEIEGSATDGEDDSLIFGSSEAAKQFLEQLEKNSGGGSHSGADSINDPSQKLDGQIVTDSDEEVDTDEEGDGKELFDSAALAALLKAATGAGSDGGGITITSQDGSKLFSVERPAGLGSSLQSVKPTTRSIRPNLFTQSNLIRGGESESNLSEEDRQKLEKLQRVRVKFLRLLHRLGHSAEDSVAGQVLYRLALVAGRQASQLFSLDSAKRTAMELEAEQHDNLDFSLNILVLGKSGAGKSATINSIFGEDKAPIHAFESGTTVVREINGTVDGVKIRIIDTPGLKSSGMEQSANRKVLSSVKKLIKKCPPDIVLYVDRLDSPTRDLNDLPLLRTITSSLGSSIWRNALVTLTHSASAPPDGPAGTPLSYEMFVTQRSNVIHQSIGQSVGDLRLMNPSMMNPVSLVENHPSCRKNRDGQKILPNGQSWRPQLLLLCYSMKILSEASSLSKPQDPFDQRKFFGFRTRSPPLPYLLSALLQSRTHPKLSAEQGGDNVDSDIDLDDLSDGDQEEEEDEYDQLPPFKPLRKSQLARLSNEQKKSYFEEYDYRVKLLQKKQWREELRRMREIKKKGKVAADEYGYMEEDVDQENEAPAAVPVPLPDMALPPSFDGDNPAYRYRFLEPSSQFLARPVLDTHGWDHDCGYDGVNVEQSLAIASRFPAAVTVQVTKDKKDFNMHLDSSIAAKYGENGSAMAGFDIQNVGKQLAYIVRGDTKFKSFRKNKTAAGVSVTFLGEHVATGVKLEDEIAVGKRLVLVGSTGTVRSQGDSVYGANLEVRLKEADFPIGQDQSSLSLSLVKWRGDLALGANLQSQISVGRNSKVAVRAGLNNKRSGQISIRTSSSDQLQIALVGILPVAMSIYKFFCPGVSENSSMY